MKRSRTVRTTLRDSRESLLWLARQNENGLCYQAAAKLYRKAGDEESAKRCEEMEKA